MFARHRESYVVGLVDFPNEGLPQGVEPATGWPFARDLRGRQVRLDLSYGRVRKGAKVVMGRSHSRSYGQWATLIRRNLGLWQIFCANVIQVSSPAGGRMVSNGPGFGFCTPGGVFKYGGLAVINIPDKVLSIQVPVWMDILRQRTSTINAGVSNCPRVFRNTVRAETTITMVRIPWSRIGNGWSRPEGAIPF